LKAILKWERDASIFLSYVDGLLDHRMDHLMNYGPQMIL
jgi:hypothetical protein